VSIVRPRSPEDVKALIEQDQKFLIPQEITRRAASRRDELIDRNIISLRCPVSQESAQFP